MQEGWTCPSCGHAPEESDGIPVFAPALARGNGSDADYAFAAILAAEARHFWFQGRSRLIEWGLGKYFPHSRRLLEIGCGTGFVLGEIRDRFPSLEAVATDSLLESLRHAATRLGPGVLLLQVDARDIPYFEDFDVLGAFDVIEHIDEDEAVLKAMFQALRPGGGLLLTVPQHPFLWSAVDDWSRHRRRYTRAELLGKLARAGFQTLRATSFSTLLLPAILLARARPAPAEFDPCFELRIHPALNAVFGGLSSVERAMIHAGCSFPVGGSLFVVARRPA